MFALNIFGGPPTRFVVCASKPWPVSSACINFQGPAPLRLKCSLSKKIHLGGSTWAHISF